MKMSERRAASALRIKALATQVEAPATAPKPRLRVYMGGLVTALAMKIAMGLETAAVTLARWTESKAEQHSNGSACPHCSGTGRYRFHTDSTRNERCFRCNGKGTLDLKDLGFLNKRLSGAGPVCWVVTA
ncbi:hypothetical protein NL64_06270 [Pseudomonas fluorescens]|uniref:hypothetical protein n=1 Tax=Pseudomonas fluorescens TaxID=294 RepID=UPI00054B65DF|nr:hypothetical protein [Pseudomonas fluorescens]KII34864.1 hypothetical protein NL64_06270 [Pseudomonas fluorescens]